MRNLRLLWVVAPIFVGACSFINAPDDPVAGTSTGSGGSGGDVTTTGGTGGSGGSTTTPTETAECGDGKVTGTEACDDAGTTSGDGCAADCTVEPGYGCSGGPDEVSVCAKLCGNETVDPGEQCDDGGKGDPNPDPGDQDFCTDKCEFQEFDIEAHGDASAGHELPTTGFREEGGVSTFTVLWHATAQGKILGRQYGFDGTYQNGPTAVDIATSPAPDPSGERFCTAPSNRSLVFWRDGDLDKILSRKIESGMISDALATNIPIPQTNPSCAAAPGGTFIVTAVTNPGGPVLNVTVQPFTSFAAPMGNPIDIGDTLAPNATTSWAVSNGFMVAWIADPAGGGALVAQELDKNGQLVGGLSPISLPDDPSPREPWGERHGMEDQFVFAYSRDSQPDPDGNVHREVVIRIFQAPGNGGVPKIVSSDSNPQSQPRVAVNPTNGKFVVVWTAGQAGSENVLMLAFEANGTAIGTEKVVHESQFGQQNAASAVVDPKTGNVAVVWNNVPNAGKPAKISARIFAGLLN